MNEQRLIAVVEELSSLIEISEEQKMRLIEGYKNLNLEQIVYALAMKIYLIVGEESINYNKAIEILLEHFPEIQMSLDDVRAYLKNIFGNMNSSKMALKENHAIVKEYIVKSANIFNELKIDYYIVGALPCFIKTKQPLFRYHDDIDIMVNEEDLPLVAEAVDRLGMEFHDDRFPSRTRYDEMQENKPPHTVLAQHLDNEFHLGFFCFRREKDNSITMREYMHRLEDEEVVVDVRERPSTPLGTALRYDEEETQYEGVSFRTGSLESVYNLKSYTQNPKDLADMRKLAPFIDKEKLIELGQNKNGVVILENVLNPNLKK